MKSDINDRVGMEIAEHLISLPDEEFIQEMERLQTEDPEMYTIINEILTADGEPQTMPDEYTMMPDTLDMAELNRPPPFVFSLEGIDKIYQDAKKSVSEE